MFHHRTNQPFDVIQEEDNKVANDEALDRLLLGESLKSNEYKGSLLN